jgi:phosphotransferase system  glucose/maltose/N-acetylglucosamine-specific IIC component
LGISRWSRRFKFPQFRKVGIIPKHVFVVVVVGLTVVPVALWFGVFFVFVQWRVMLGIDEIVQSTTNRSVWSVVVVPDWSDPPPWILCCEIVRVGP